jgi:hypothetical protein
LLLGGLVLNYIPVLGQNPVLDAKYVNYNPSRRLAAARKPPVYDYEISICHNYSRFILECWREALDEIKQALATRLNIRTMLYVVRRPIVLSRYIVTLIE